MCPVECDLTISLAVSFIVSMLHAWHVKAAYSL